MARLRNKKGNLILEDADIGVVNDLYLESDSNNTLEVDIRIHDIRTITDSQRKFIFALCNDISYSTGNDSEYIRMILQQYNANLRKIDVESLSNCSVTYANGLIDTIINFCIEHDIAIEKEHLDNYQYTFDEKQTYMMCLKRECVICGGRADLHHVDHVGTRINRDKGSHVGLRMLPLCRKHHNEVHNTGEEKFIDKYHLTPITVDKKMEYFIKKGIIREFNG